MFFADKISFLKIILTISLGVQDFCPRESLHGLTAVGLQLLVEGRRDIDVSQWRTFTDLKGIAEGNTTVDCFWEVVAELSETNKTKLLCFAIGTTSLPSGGFVELKPKFQLVISSGNIEELPTSHTCFHTLIIPKYPDKEKMKEKILLAITETGTAQLGIV